MIFISYSHGEQELVQVIASRLSEIYGKEKIFYDEWSIQPGDWIIDEMNKVLIMCKFFFYFVSKKSVESKMVALEWQNALLKSMREDVKFIPVRIENCVVPPILTQTLYIDIVTYGIEVGIRQMIDVIEGNNTFKKSDSSFSNLYCLIDNISPQEMIIEIKAKYYLEPLAKFIFFFNNDMEKLHFKLLDENEFSGGLNRAVKFDSFISDCYFMGGPTPITPEYSFKVKVSTQDSQPLSLKGVMHQEGKHSFRGVPIKK